MLDANFSFLTSEKVENFKFKYAYTGPHTLFQIESSYSSEDQRRKAGVAKQVKAKMVEDNNKPGETTILFLPIRSDSYWKFS
jgi:hypothetical protein